MPRVGAWQWQRSVGQLLCSIAVLLVCTPCVTTAASSVVAIETPQVEQQLSGIPLFSPHIKLCTKAVRVCARELQPLGVEIGGTFTVKIEDHYKSTYECSIVNGAPTWVPTSVEGSCEAQPVILLPAKYDVGEAWNVG